LLGSPPYLTQAARTIDLNPDIKRRWGA